MRQLDTYWQDLNPVALSLLPLAGLFFLLLKLRRGLYRRGWLNSVRLPVPVLVVGNIRVGGSGKSPLVAALALALKARGWRPGIIARGYGGRARQWPQAVHAGSDPGLLGDEPVMLAQLTGCPLWVGPDRVAAAQALLAENDCDLILSDDGLQHYRLRRDLEIALIDGQRRHGNGLLLPAGPLREPLSRLDQVDWRLTKGRAGPGEMALELGLGDAVGLSDPQRRRPLGQWVGQSVHALAGIAHPESFFGLLRRQGLRPITHPFADHHAFKAADIRFDDDKPVLMTHKDAVKCQGLADQRHWYVPLQARLPAAFIHQVDLALQTITGKING
ncbi:tetraacyldisaccharide 4'-kinase [Magnetovirga frankeli]|uniref:tetraacyldisaccharide 4'-kinase n=1 Tax=Magnetovirga frankeli TaxID=947516 RepID=UPI001292D3A1|nr:tetraacyldisaccharide 4'-kinase [gamma proteobacterium SS-5]